MSADQFGRDLEEDEESSSPNRSETDRIDYDLRLLDEDEYEIDEDDRELCRIRREDIRYINGDR